MDLLWYPHDILKNESVDLTLEQIQSETFKKVVSRMFLIMYRMKGVGLAAPQVGINVNLIVGNPTGRPSHESQAFVLINPEIIYGDGLQTDEEGCLSFPGIYGEVTRPNKIQVKSLDVSGKEIFLEAEGFLSRIIQHEYDHLKGILFIDRMSKEARREIEANLAGHEKRVSLIRKKREKQKRKEAAKEKKAAKKKRKK